MHTKSIKELAGALKKKQFSSVELTQYFIDRIKKYNNKINAFITISEEAALKSAAAADERISNGDATLLTGIPISHKDLFCTKGIKTSAGSKMLDNFISPYNATVVEKLNSAGTIIVGKNNMDEFAMGSSNEHSYYGPCKNPWDLSTVPGGSSGGGAASVAARLVPMATGSDTGGSIRQPASLCGITGIKPTYGRISRFGMIAFASSFDQCGILTQSAEDAAICLNHMMGFDPKDSTSVDQPVGDLTKNLENEIKGLKIGLPKECFSNLLPDEIKVKVMAAANELEKLGAKLQEISLPNLELGLPAYYVIAPAECSSNLSRYDGIRFGYRCKDPENLLDLFERTRAEGFGSEVKHRIMLGTYVLSSGYYDNYYKQAQKIRRMISNDYANAFKKVDVILSPTSPTTAFKIGSKTDDRVNMYLSDIFTVATNLAGLTGLSMPGGFIDNLPIGIQLTGNYFREEQILNVAHKYQQATDWHMAMPEGF